MIISEKLKLRVYSFFTLLYIFTIFIHNIKIFKNLSSIKFSEVIFLIFFLLYFFFNYRKIITTITKNDLIFFLWPLLNFIQFLYNPHNLYGVISSIYVFTIYLLFKNLFLDLGQKKIIRYLILSLLFSSLLSIVGWVTSQFNIDLNLAEYKEGFPIYIIEKYRSHGLFPTPNMLFFYLSLGFLIIQNFNFKNKNYILVFIFFGIFFTLSKSLIIFFPLIFFPYIFKYGKLVHKQIYVIFFLLMFILFNFFTNFIVAPKKINFFEEHRHSNYMMSNSKALFDNSHVSIYKTNYAELKIKSFNLIKENFFIGIGFDNFNKTPINGFSEIQVYKPHSSIIGLIVENGILSIVIYYLIGRSILHFPLKNKNYFFLSALLFIFVESINTDIHYFKILWIIFPLMMTKKLDNL